MSGSRRASDEDVGHLPDGTLNGQQRRDSDNAHLSSEQREAMDYWGTLIETDRTASEKLERLLLGIARYITLNIDPHDCKDLTPSQLANFYRSVGGDYDILFDKTSPRSISFIYKSIGCLHSLQPPPSSSGFDIPEIPALKPKGFVRWQTVQLLLGPEEHVPFLQSAVRQFEILDKDGMRFPDVLPKECFPERPDERMLQWYQQVSENLKREAQTNGGLGGGIAPGGAQRPPSTASTLSSMDGHDEDSSPPGTGPAAHSQDSTYRVPRERPSIARQGSRNVRDDRLVYGVRHVRGNPSPPNIRRSGFTRQYSEGSASSEDETVLADTLTPTGIPIRHHPRSPLNKSSRIDSISSSDDDDARHRDGRRSPRSPPRDDDRVQPIPRKSPTSAKRLRPELRYRRSHDQPSTSGDYFNHQDSGMRRHSVQGQQGGFAPSKAPPFAAQVAAAQLRGSYTQSTTVPRYTNEDDYLRPSSGRYGSETSLGRRERERERDRDRGRKTRPTYEKTNVSGERFYDEGGAAQRRGKRSSEEREWDRIGRDGERERERSISDWERERERDWENDRDRDRDRDRRGGPAHRYVAPTGVGGRRYPPETWN